MDDTAIPRILRMIFSPGKLESQTEFFDDTFEGLNLADLPEYQTAIDAMNAYREAVALRYEEESKRQRGE